MERKKVKTLRHSLEAKAAQGQSINRHSLVADIGSINTDMIQLALDKKYYGV